MNGINKIGLRIVGVTIALLLLVSGIAQGLLWGFSVYKNSRAIHSPSPSAQPSPSSSAAIASQEVITPQLTQDLTSLANTAQQTLVGYTKEYIETLPPNVSKEQVLDQKTLEAFIDSHKGTLLTELPPGTVKTSNAAGKTAVQKYLDTVSSSHNKEVATVTGDAILTALDKQQSGEELEALVPIQSALKKNFSLFSAVQAPTEVAVLHTKLLQATQSLITNTKLLQDMRYDVVAGLIGQRNLTDLNAVFSDVASQIAALETKYDIK